MNGVSLNSRNLDAYNSAVPEPVKKPVVESENTIDKTRSATGLLSLVAGVAAGAYVQIALEHPKNFLVTLSLLPLAGIACNGKVKWLNRLPEAGLFLSSAFMSSLIVGASIDAKKWCNDTYTSISKGETAGYLALAAACVVHAQIVIDLAKLKQRTQDAAKVEAQTQTEAAK